MKVEMGHRAWTSLSAAYSRARSYVQHRHINLGAASRIESLSPRTVASRIDATEQVSGIMTSLNQAIEAAAAAQQLTGGRMVDIARRAENEATKNIFGENGTYFNRLRENLYSFYEHPSKILKLAMSSAAFYGAGLLLSATFPSLAIAIPAIASACTIATITFGTLHNLEPTNSKMKWLVENLRTRGLLLTLAGTMTTVPYLLFKSQLNIGNLFHVLPCWGIYGLLGAAGLVILANLYKSAKDYSDARMSMVESPSKWHGIIMATVAQTAAEFKLGILTYIPLMYIAALYGFCAMLAVSPLFAFTTVTGVYSLGKWALNKNKDMADGMANFTLGLAVGTLPLLALGGTAVFYFPTLFVFAPLCMLWVNAHAGIPSLSSATSHTGALLYPTVPPVSDTYKQDVSYGVRGGKGRSVLRLNAFIHNQDTNLSNVINMLINPYPDVEFESCEEKRPWDDPGDFEKALAAKEFHAHRDKWQSKIYSFIAQQFQKLEALDPKTDGYQEKLTYETERLAWVMERIGRRLSEETEFEHEVFDPTKIDEKEKVVPFMQQIMELVEEDALSLDELKAKPGFAQTRTTKQPWFNHELAPQFYAEGFNPMKMRARNFFFPLAKMIRDAIERGETLSREDLENEYLRLLDIYSTRANHIIRRLEHHDEQINQKTNNLAFVLSHAGDTLYKVWVVSADEKQFYIEHIPSEFIRIDNPDRHYKTAKKYLWVRREDAMKVNQPLCNSQSGSEEIELILNAPAQDKLKQDKLKKVPYKGTKIDAYETDEEVLPVTGMRLRDFAKEGKTPEERTTAGERLQGKHLWAPAMKKSRVTGWDASTRRALYDSDARTIQQFDAAFKSWVASRPEKYREKYQEIIAKNPKMENKLWFEDPDVVVIRDVDNRDYFLVSDEEYIDFSSYVQLQAELQHDASQQKNVRLFQYKQNKHEIPYPCPERLPGEIVQMERRGSPIEIGYYDQASRSWQVIPYHENRTRIIKGNDPMAEWKEITHAIAERKNGKKVLKLYSFIGRPDESMEEGINLIFKKEIPEDDYPDHLPPPEKLKDTNGDPQRITFNVFPDRIGMYGYYMFDFGENYGTEPWQRYRFVREDEKPWQLWLNLITKMERVGKGGKRLRIESLYPEAQVVPFSSGWADPGEEGHDRFKVTEVSTSRERVVALYQRKDKTLYNEYAPTAGQLPANNEFRKRIKERKVEPLGDNSALGLIRFKVEIPNADGTTETIERETVVPLTENLNGLQDSKKARDILVGRLNRETGKVTFVEGRQFDHNPETAASYLYTLKDHSRLVPPDGKTAVVIPDYRWITDTRIEKRKDTEGNEKYVVCVTYKKPKLEKEPVAEEEKGTTVEIDGRCLVDNEGVELLKNINRGMDSLDSFFHATQYSKATERFRPELTLHEGLPTLRLHATKKERTTTNIPQKMLAKLKEFIPEDAEEIEVFVASPTSAVRVIEKEPSKKGEPCKEKWVPLSLVEPIDDRDLKVKGKEFCPGRIIIEIRTPDPEDPKKVCVHTQVIYSADIEKDKAEIERAHEPYPNHYVYALESVVFPPDIIHGDYGMVVHRQNSFGGTDAGEVRDQYFYTRHHGIGCEIRYPRGEFNDPRLGIGLQPGKNNIFDFNRVSHSDAIENGTPFMTTFGMLDELARITGYLDSGGHLHPGNMESAEHHPFVQKIVTFSVFMGCLNGVSEDEELKKVMKKATGRKLRYWSYPTAVVAQPNDITKLKTQNLERYNTSAQLYTDIERGQVRREFIQGWITHKSRRIFTPKELLETFMTGFWYPGLPFSEIGQVAGPAVYLLSGGAIQPYIVDHVMFLSFVISDTSLSGINYGLARYHGGFSPAWSFWHGPARDPISLLGGYYRGSRRMIKEDWQYGQFVVTAEQKGKTLPPSYKSFIRFFYATGGISTTLGIFALAAAATAFGITGIFSFAVLAVLLNTGWGGYKYKLFGASLKWLKTLEMDMKDNPQTVDGVICRLNGVLQSASSGRAKIFELMEARHLAGTTLLDIGFHPFEVRNDPNRSEEQLRNLLHTAFVLDHKLLAEAEDLAQNDNIEDKLMAMTILKHLGLRSFSHDIGVLATRAYKRVIFDREEAKKMFDKKIEALDKGVKEKDIDLKNISEIYFMASACWDLLNRAEKKAHLNTMRTIAAALTKKITAKIESMPANNAEDLEKVAGVIGAIQPLLPLIDQKLMSTRVFEKVPVIHWIYRRVNRVNRINRKVREKMDAYQKGSNLEGLKNDLLAEASSKEKKDQARNQLNFIYSMATLGRDRETLSEANALKVKILDILIEEAGHKHQADFLPKYKTALTENDALALEFNSFTVEVPVPLLNIRNRLEGFITLEKETALKLAEKTEEKAAIETKYQKACSKLLELKTKDVFDKNKAELVKISADCLDNIRKANNKSIDRLMDLLKEKAILAPDKTTRNQAKNAISELFDKQIAAAASIPNLKERAKALKDAVELLTGHYGINDDNLSFESMPGLGFIFDEIIPAKTKQMIKILRSCGSAAADIGIAAGENPDQGTFLDRALRLNKKRTSVNLRLKRKGISPVITMPESTAQKSRRISFENLIRASQPSIQKAGREKAFNADLGKLADNLLKMVTDFRATELAEERKGVIDFIEKILLLERESVLKLRGRNGYDAALGDYKKRVDTFKNNIKIFVAKKHSKHFQIADIYAVADRFTSAAQKAELVQYYRRINELFERPIAQPPAAQEVKKTA